MIFFRFIPVKPHPLLDKYVSKIYVFESSGRLPADERKTIVPNANLKLTLTFSNGIIAHIGNKTYTQSEHQLSLSGLIDVPVLLDTERDVKTGTIVIEFNPLGAYRFFKISFTAIKNEIINLTDIFGKQSHELESKLAETDSIAFKLGILQDFLLYQLIKNEDDLIFDYCINKIYEVKGLVTVRQLEKQTGYSSRWLHAKFTDHIGAGPKNVADIVRFGQVYQSFAANVCSEDFKAQIFKYYHDQSHFIKAFKRFTGLTPTGLQNSINELATKHFKS